MQTDSTPSVSPFMFEVFFDGDCPLCMREIRMLMRRDRDKNIRFTNIADSSFEAERVGISWGALMAEIHGRMPDGRIVVGVEVFRQLYSAVGFRPVVALTRIPGISHLLDVGYAVFAKNRLRLTGRCTKESCEVHQKPG